MRELRLDGVRIRQEDAPRILPVRIRDDFHVQFNCRPGAFHRYFQAEFSDFAHPAVENPDIVLRVAPFTVRLEPPARRFDELWVGKDWVYGFFVHKVLGRWQVLIHGFSEEQPQVLFWGTPLSRWFVQNRVVEPMIRHQLSLRGCSLFHGAAVARGGGGLFIPAVRHTGKTTTAFQLLDAGYEFLADDYTLIADDGRVHPYPRRINLFAYHRRTNPTLRKRLSARRLAELFRKELIRVASGGFASFATPVPLRELYPEATYSEPVRLSRVVCLSSGCGRDAIVRHDISVEEAVTLATANNRREARDFWNLLLAAEYAGIDVSAEGWFERERRLLTQAFSRARLSEVVLPAAGAVDPQAAAALVTTHCEDGGP